MDNVYYQFAILLVVASAVGALAIRLRQPLIVAFIVVGIALGPSGVNWVTAHEEVNLLAQIGVTVLLFVVGLKLDLHMVKSVGPVALATGVGQLLFTIVIGVAISLALGMSAITAFYVAVALTFSSTIIIVKLLSDKREVDSLHGRIAVGFLIVQDVAVVVAMLLLGSYQGGEGGAPNLWMTGLVVVLKIAAALALTVLLMRFVLPRVLRLLAQSQDLLLIFAVAWGTVLAACGDLFGFSKEVGAFLAGFSLASTPYREAIASRLTGLRDFLLLFFFIEMGGNLDLGILGDQIPAAVVLSLFVLIGNPLIVMAIMGYMGYRKRTGFLAGLTVAQISEFSIVFTAMGISLGHIATPALGLVTMVGLVTITLSTYMILYSYKLYARMAPWLGWFERKEPWRELAVESAPGKEVRADVIVFGAGRFGRRLLRQLRARGYSVLAVDFDPEAVRILQAQGIPVHYGDAEDVELAATLPLASARWIVSTLTEESANRLLMQVVREHGFQGKTAVVLRSGRYEESPAGLVVDRVFRPYDDAADFATEEIAHALAPRAAH